MTHDRPILVTGAAGAIGRTVTEKHAREELHPCEEQDDRHYVVFRLLFETVLADNPFLKIETA